MSRLNKLEFGTKKKTLFSIALLHSERFRKSRKETEEGRELYNEELEMAKNKVEQFDINLSKPLPQEL